MSLTGHPRCIMQNDTITGDSIYAVIDTAHKTLKSALVIRNAHGIQIEPSHRQKPGQHIEVFGDTLYAEFEQGKLKRLYVNLKANGFFFEKDFSSYKNKMKGHRLDISFKNGKISNAVISGDAQSTYYYVEEKERLLSGKNESTGDTIHISFDPWKNTAKDLRIISGKSLASGRYTDLTKLKIYGEEKSDAKLLKKKRIHKPRKKGEKTNESSDSNYSN